VNFGYEPVAYFLNPFSLDTTRYCEEEDGYHLLDPVTIPEIYDASDGFFDPDDVIETPYMAYEYECQCANGYIEYEGSCKPCHEIDDHCTACERVSNKFVCTACRLGMMPSFDKESCIPKF